VGTTSGTGWLLQDSAGDYTNSSNNFVWMNPLVPEVRNLIKGIVVDAINQFDLQIVQFDDHLAWPVQFGWDDYTKAVYKQETNRNLPSNYLDSNFRTWRQGKTQALFDEIAVAARAAKPSVVVSLSPSTASFSAANYCADWSKWLTTTDEVLPQVYRSTYSSFATDWAAQITASGTSRPELGSGLRLLGTGSATPWTDLQQQLDRTRTDGALGHSIWYSEGVSASGTSNPSNYNAQLKAYYDVATNGPSANPHFTSVRWSGTAGTGGSGTWSTLAPQWKDRSTIWVQDAVGIFDGAGGTVTVSGTVGVAGGLDFRTAGYTVTGGTMALRGYTRAANAITVAPGVTATIASPLTGTTGLTKAGAGVLVLAGANSFSGTTSIQGGVLRLAHRSALAANGVSVLAGGTLAVSSRLTATVAALDPGAGGLVDVGDGAITVTSGLSASDLVAAILSGRGNGSWAGSSGITSTAVATDLGRGIPRAVGWLGAGSGSMTIAYAALGDTNLDWQIDVLDAANMLSAGKFNAGTAARWADGDFNYDGQVNVLDVANLMATGLFDAGPYRFTGLGQAAVAVAAVPEPAMTAWAAVIAAMAIRAIAGRRGGTARHR
jgi:autotransporter-associated beta strand protein